MCVIAIVHNDTKRPVPMEVEAMWDTNDHGGGVAWFEKEKGKQSVLWKKGLDLNQMQELARELPVPYVLHFRIASAGEVSKSLTHPFPITPEVDLALEGSTREYPILFQNGHWSPWETKALEYASLGNYRLPGGKWSDTRVLAQLAHYRGIGALEILGGSAMRFVVMDPTGEVGKRVGAIGKFTVYDERYLVSNEHWRTKLAGLHHAETFRGQDYKVNDNRRGNVISIRDRASSNGAAEKVEHVPVIAGEVVKSEVVTSPVKVKLIDTRGPSDADGGGSLADSPFGVPLSFYEGLHSNRRITAKQLVQVKKYFNRLRRYPESKGNTKPKVMLQTEQKLLPDYRETLH